ncbi:MAG TPA: diaminopimelate epimerase [Gammaproteobacteria bacterium]
MPITFTKMHGAGNDFVVVDATVAPFDLARQQRRQIADRRFGVGCDQLLVVEPARGGGEDFSWRIYNADGGEVEQCGNGARCVARFIHDKNLSRKTRLRLGSLGGIVQAELLEDGVRVNMGAPAFAPDEIPFTADAEALTYAIDLEGESLDVGVVSMGNPHAVLTVSDVGTTPVADLGEMLESHSRFPERANVGFMQRLDASHVKLRVFERGVGETQACGTGACAAVVWGILAGQLDQDVEVQLPGGALMVSWRGRGEPVFLAGPAVTVFEGTFLL